MPRSEGTSTEREQTTRGRVRSLSAPRFAPRAAIAALAACLVVALPTSAVASEHRTDHRSTSDASLVVHSAPGNPNGGAGTWAWTWLGYHPDGYQIYADGPSHAVVVMRNLDVGDMISFTGMVCGAYRVTSVDSVLTSERTSESDAVMHISASNGLHTVVAELVIPCLS